VQTVRPIERAHVEALVAKEQYTHLSLLRLKLDLLGGDGDPICWLLANGSLTPGKKNTHFSISVP
jgi:hypothetical protein